MQQELLHIYGPFSIQWYGLMILLGLVVFLWRSLKNPLRKAYISSENYLNLVTSSIFAGIIGGRALNIISERENYQAFADVFKIWEGGFSILGTIGALGFFVPWYLHRHKIPLLPILDLVALYAPLLQAIARIGCLCAGCCHGTATTVAWAIRCHNPNSPELYNALVHPTQLYSAALLFAIFLVLRYAIYKRIPLQGVLVACYLMFVGFERFVLDFWRSYRVMIAHLSLYQAVSGALMAIGILLLIFYTLVRPKKYEHL